MSEVERKILEYLAEEAGVEQDLAVDASLVEGGVLDSFDIVALSAFIAKEYAVKIKPLEVNLDNFDSVQKISSFISRKLD